MLSTKVPGIVFKLTKSVNTGGEKMILDKIWNFVMLKRKRVQVGTDLRINGRIYIHGRKNCIKIGDNCTIQSAHYVNPTSGSNHTHLNASYGGTIIIGNNVGISHSNITAYESVEIEDNVLIGSGVKIWDTDFHSIRYENRMQHPDPDIRKEPIRIKEGAFIGACSLILKGVTIGQHAVIGAGSVVAKDVPDHEIWAGNPAQKIGEVTKLL